MAEQRAREHDNDVEIGPLGKEGDKLMTSIQAGNMVAVVSGMEIMYTFLYRGRYQCFIHKMEAEEGRHKDWEINERNTAMLKNLPAAADYLFEIKFKPHMDMMGVMVAAETGIIRLMDMLGTLPAEDTDFMAPYKEQDKEEHE